jgi:hypothetical protein
MSDRLSVTASLAPGEAVIIVRDPGGTDFVCHQLMDAQMSSNVPMHIYFDEALSSIEDCKRRENELQGRTYGSD